jgi:nicotinate-nucleotide adenylyltransferase
MRLGILGGTFNPIHLGHLRLAEEAMRQLKLDKIIFVPAYLSPFASTDESVSVGDRLNMLEETLKKYESFEVSTYELDKKDTSYTIDTIKNFKKTMKAEDELYFIAGGDIAARLNEWKDIGQLCKLCKFVIAKRPGFNEESKVDAVEYINIEAIDISSSEIRDIIKRKGNYKDMVPINVFKYINEKQLYR